MVGELLLWLLGCALVIGVASISYHRRLKHMKACYRQLEEYADSILQHFQGTVLNVQGIVSDLAPEDRVRQRIEYALENADKRLAQIREWMQPMCSEEQSDRIQ